MQGIVLANYSKFEHNEPPESKLSEEAIKRRLKRLPDPGISGKNKVSALAKDLAHKLEGGESLVNMLTVFYSLLVKEKIEVMILYMHMIKCAYYVTAICKTCGEPGKGYMRLLQGTNESI